MRYATSECKLSTGLSLYSYAPHIRVKLGSQCSRNTRHKRLWWFCWYLFYLQISSWPWWCWYFSGFTDNCLYIVFYITFPASLLTISNLQLLMAQMLYTCMSRIFCWQANFLTSSHCDTPASALIGDDTGGDDLDTRLLEGALKNLDYFPQLLKEVQNIKRGSFYYVSV